MLQGTSWAVSTPTTPSMAWASSASMDSTRARAYCERTADRWAMFSISTSSGYTPVPSTLSRTSTRNARLPTP